MDAKEAVAELRQQERELAVQKLDNIINHFEYRANVYENLVKRNQAEMDLAAAQGREERENDYYTSMSQTQSKLNTLIEERNTLEGEFNNLVAQGYIQQDSEDWFKYKEQMDELDISIVNVKKDIIDLQDAANKVRLTKLQYQLDELANSASHVDEMINLRAVQANEEYAESYKTLIDNGFEQIRILQEQIYEYRRQQIGLDKLSAKYQELEQNIQSNITAINQMKVSQEEWNDSVYDIEIDKIEKFKDQLSKTNDLYERQKNLQEAIQNFQKASSQRTQRIYRTSQGFSYETDRETLKDAQDELESVIRDELISKLDDLVDALEQKKEDTNIYDANGNIIGVQYNIPQLDNLSQILSDYYHNPNTSASVEAIKKLFSDALVSNSNVSNEKSISMNIGDIILNEVENGNDLANAIVNQLPNALLQALYKK